MYATRVAHHKRNFGAARFQSLQLKEQGKLWSQLGLCDAFHRNAHPETVAERIDKRQKFVVRTGAKRGGTGAKMNLKMPASIVIFPVSSLWSLHVAQ